jgi:hypothetical protein
MKSSLFILALMVGFYLYWEQSVIPRPAGVLAPDEPVQRAAAYPATVREINGYRVAPLASFDIRARVIRSERYRFGSVADLSPVDLVLGWGAMSDSAVLKQISFSQGGRFYHWWTSNFPVPRRVIETYSANMHMIPANGALARQLKSIRSGNMVHLKGWLVEATTKEGFRWTSSLTREDTGGGACELILVESLDVW